MARSRRFKTNEKGQATLEFIIVFPLLFSLFLLALAAAAVWHGHHLSSAVSLEAASRESVQPGSGGSFVYGVGNSLSQNTEFSVGIHEFTPTLTGAPAKRLTVSGTVSVPWAPLGLNWSTPVRGTTIYPVWEFHGK
jgi:hypothetical protein